MKTSIAIELQAFAVPTSVREKISPHPTVAPVAPSVDPHSDLPYNKPFIGMREFNLEELDADTLSKMCDEFRNEVFKRAGKTVTFSAE